MNPCPCGHAGDPTRACVCAAADVLRYRVAALRPARRSHRSARSGAAGEHRATRLVRAGRALGRHSRPGGGGARAGSAPAIVTTRAMRARPGAGSTRTEVSSSPRAHCSAALPNGCTSRHVPSTACCASRAPSRTSRRARRSASRMSQKRSATVRARKTSRSRADCRVPTTCVASGMPTIAIIGPGAIGGILAAWLGQDPHNDVTVCARTPFDRLEVETPTGAIACVAARAHRSGACDVRSDWVLIATKAYDAASAARWLARLRRADTPVVVLQNGVEHVERFAPYVAGANGLLPAVIDCPGRAHRRQDACASAGLPGSSSPIRRTGAPSCRSSADELRRVDRRLHDACLGKAVHQRARRDLGDPA